VSLVEEVEQFLYREARLLDEEQWRPWLALFTPDVHYWVPGVQARHRRSGGVTYDPEAMAFFDDTLEELTRRVLRFEQETAWSEDPATRAAHMISNVEVEAGSDANEYIVRSTFVLHRLRNEDERYQTPGRRVDLIRRTPDGLRIARRHVYLLETVLLSKNINTFF
jgi:ethylbenzene dioxygenase beta subunit